MQQNASLKVQILSPLSGRVTYNVFDGAGRNVRTGVLTTNGVIGTRGLTAGTYVLQILRVNEKKNLQFIIQ